MIESHAIRDAVSGDYSKIWLCVMRFGLSRYRFGNSASPRDEEIPLFTSVISYNGSLAPVLFLSPSPGVDTNLLRGLIFPPLVFCPD